MGPILIVEDQLIIGMELRDVLEDNGFRVIGPEGRLAAAIALARSEPLAAAILDFDLHGEPVVPLARELRERGVPLLILSAYPPASILTGALEGLPHMEKPAEPDLVLACLREIMGPDGRA
ncbi:MAG TPA: hypothetical protein VEB20_13035 [Azospirillaceae bacterium]|nr:hypothetical protein [Azospirillaceae bacterium]